MKISDIQQEISQLRAVKNQKLLAKNVLSRTFIRIYRAMVGESFRIKSLKHFLKNLESTEGNRELIFEEMCDLIEDVLIDKLYQCEALIRALTPDKCKALKILYALHWMESDYLKAVIYHPKPENVLQAVIYLSSGIEEHSIPSVYFSYILQHRNAMGVAWELAKLFDDGQRHVSSADIRFLLNHDSVHTAAEMLSILHYVNLKKSSHLAAIPVGRLKEVHAAIQTLQWSNISLTEKYFLKICQHSNPAIAAQSILNSMRTQRMEHIYLPFESVLLAPSRRPFVAPIRIPTCDNELDFSSSSLSTSRSL